MTISNLKVEEGIPAAGWPTLEAQEQYTGDDRRSVDPIAVWRRIEAYTRYRWPSRTVTFLIKGAGEWEPTLQPFTLVTAEKWDNEAWTQVTLRPGPLGHLLDGGTYRITGSVGDDGQPPEDVMEAAARLYEFFSGVGAAWLDDFANNENRAHNWAARTLQLSGAADLLRTWRILR